MAAAQQRFDGMWDGMGFVVVWMLSHRVMQDTCAGDVASMGAAFCCHVCIEAFESIRFWHRDASAIIWV